MSRVDATCNVQQGVEKDVDNHNCTKQPKMTKKRCGETTSNHATSKRSKVPTVITQIAAEVCIWIYGIYLERTILPPCISVA